MTEEHYPELSFDEEIGDIEAPDEGQTKFARIGLYIFNFAKGGPFELPGVFEDTYDDATEKSVRIGPKTFNRQRLKGKVNMDNPTICIVVLEMENKHGESWQDIKQCTNFLQKTDELDEKGKPIKVNFFKELQWPQLKAAEGDGALKALAKANSPERWPYGRFTYLDSEIPSIHGPTLKYPGNFVIYPDEATWRKAQEEFYTPRNGEPADSPNAWISDELERAVAEATNGVWGGNLDVLKDQAIKVDGKPPAVQAKMLEMPGNEELAAEVVARAMEAAGVPF